MSFDPFILHYEIQVRVLPKTEDEDCFSFKLTQHQEGVSKCINAMLCISGFTVHVQQSIDEPKTSIEVLSEFLNDSISKAFKEGMKELDKKWDTLPELVKEHD